MSKKILTRLLTERLAFLEKEKELRKLRFSYLKRAVSKDGTTSPTPLLSWQFGKELEKTAGSSYWAGRYGNDHLCYSIADGKLKKLQEEFSFLLSIEFVLFDSKESTDSYVRGRQEIMLNFEAGVYDKLKKAEFMRRFIIKNGNFNFLHYNINIKKTSINYYLKVLYEDDCFAYDELPLELHQKKS